MGRDRISVHDHLAAGPPVPVWVLELGEHMQRLEQLPAAVAASRARDLYRQEPVARALEQLLAGWNTLSAAEMTALSRLQRDSVRQVLTHLLQTLLDGIPEEEPHDL
jgi:hypothetical protein